ncbi:MAG: hypothetical protein ACOCW3_06160 [Spirochaetota bacterium]
MPRRLRFGFLMILFLVAATTAIAQSNDHIDAILAEDVATVGSAAYMALTAAGLADDDSPASRAVEIAIEAGWLPEAAAADEPVTFGRFAYLLMEATEVTGGLMYRMVPGPRYAAREFVYRGWSPERRSPREEITGQFLVRVTGNFLDNVEVTP